MTTIHPVGLATLIDNREPLDLIDVRTEKEFESFHIAGARSVPLKKLSAAKGFKTGSARRLNLSTSLVTAACRLASPLASLPEEAAVRLSWLTAEWTFG